MERVKEIILNNKKALIFTTFIKLIEKIATDLKAQHSKAFINYIHGKIKPDERLNIIDEFSSYKGPGVVVANTETAGVGLNITAAKYVFLYTPEWKPSTEDQAVKRAHRIGQDKNVMIYKLYYSNTIEEFMRDKVDSKRIMGKALVKGIDDIEKIDVKKILEISPLNK